MAEEDVGAFESGRLMEDDLRLIRSNIEMSWLHSRR
jgi:hypothetical protein